MKPSITLIVAMARNRVIGLKGRIPWHLAEDLRRFRQLTWGKPILMGRRTFESIGRPLPGRHNIVVTRGNTAFNAAGCTVVGSLEEGLRVAETSCKGETWGCPELMVIGGATLYAALLPRAQRIHLTQIHADYPGDTFFPELPLKLWRETRREDRYAGGGVPYAYSFILLERNGLNLAGDSRDSRC